MACHVAHLLEHQSCCRRAAERERENSTSTFSQHWLMRTRPRLSHLPKIERERGRNGTQRPRDSFHPFSRCMPLSSTDFEDCMRLTSCYSNAQPFFWPFGPDMPIKGIGYRPEQVCMCKAVTELKTCCCCRGRQWTLNSMPPAMLTPSLQLAWRNVMKCMSDMQKLCPASSTCLLGKQYATPF